MIAIPALVAKMEKATHKNTLLVRAYAYCYRDVVRREVELGEITAKDRVLNIGCGGMPYTALEIVRQTGAKVWAIDIDQDAVQAARACVAALGMEKQITVDCLDGAEHIGYPFDAAVVALQAQPKEDILNNLWKLGVPGARLIFRKPREKYLDQYDSLPEYPLPAGEAEQDKTTFGHSVLYRV